MKLVPAPRRQFQKDEKDCLRILHFHPQPYKPLDALDPTFAMRLWCGASLPAWVSESELFSCGFGVFCQERLKQQQKRLDAEKRARKKEEREERAAAKAQAKAAAKAKAKAKAQPKARPKAKATTKQARPLSQGSRP